MISVERIFTPAVVMTGLKCGLLVIALLLVGGTAPVEPSRVAASALGTFIVIGFEVALLEIVGRTWDARRDDGWFILALIGGFGFGVCGLVLVGADQLVPAFMKCAGYTAAALLWWHLLPRSAFNQDTGRLHG